MYFDQFPSIVRQAWNSFNSFACAARIKNLNFLAASARVEQFLNTFSHVFQSPCHIADNMEFINDNSGIREIFACKITVYLVHVCDKIAYLFFVWKVL